ncbi:ELWxxDGT repeat protein [Pleurocapsa sp. FMAR1]|uniref:ELWxxDGT repeat protein n=1 Tax=Pleurocapsa sp. FMAR1 TaxID=3040204 RepID=UPI0039B0CAFB
MSTANDGENGRELWVSDGTTEGTQLVKDINPGGDGSNPSNLTEFNNKLYFRLMMVKMATSYGSAMAQLRVLI